MAEAYAPLHAETVAELELAQPLLPANATVGESWALGETRGLRATGRPCKCARKDDPERRGVPARELGGNGGRLGAQSGIKGLFSAVTAEFCAVNVDKYAAGTADASAKMQALIASADRAWRAGIVDTAIVGDDAAEETDTGAEGVRAMTAGAKSQSVMRSLWWLELA
jgi:hypothetical protein